MDFRRTTVIELAEAVRQGSVSARELVGHSLSRIDALNPEINAFVAVDADRALAAARDVDERVARGDDPGELAGIPVGIKDTEDAAGLPTTFGSVGWQHAPPATGDSVLVARLKAAGAVVVGKTNAPELAMKPATDNRIHGVTRNPWNRDHTPGGSSGGSAAAVAAGMVPLGTASDGGGSIRIPSALCGLAGLKPSLGRIPDGGPHPPDWHHLTTRGVVGRTVADTTAALDAVLGPDPTDLRSLPMPEPSWLGALERAHLPNRVGWSPTLGYATPDPEIRAICERAIGRLADLGAEVVEIPDVFSEDPGGHWVVMVGSYNQRTMGHLKGTELWDQVDPVLAMTIDMAENLSAVDLVRAEDMCHLLNLRLVELFHSVRLLLTPTVAGPVPTCEPVAQSIFDLGWVQYTHPFNMTRSPAGTVPVGFTDQGVPVGLQIVGPQHGDLVVLRAMAAIEAALALDPVAPGA